MTTKAAETSKGLDGIVIADTDLSFVDGQVGKLIYHGYPIDVLARNATFEEVAYLLWHRKLPVIDELKTFNDTLIANRALPEALLQMMKHFPKNTHPMGVLRTIVSTLGMIDPEQEDSNQEANQRKAYKLTAQIATSMAVWARIREGKDIVEARDDLNHAANFLYMLNGEEGNSAEVRALDAFLVLLADHGMNASTFSSRVTTSTQGDMYSAITSGVGTLKGPSHGGANERVMRMLQEVEEPENADNWYKQMRDNNERIMGIGHRVYKVEDPRAIVLRDMARDIAETTGGSKYYKIATRIEELTRSDDFFVERKLYANVDYYSAIVLNSVGIPVDFFTPLFAMSRIVGWSAHVMEQWAENRLIRPRGQYVGPMEAAWTALEDRV